LWSTQTNSLGISPIHSHTPSLSLLSPTFKLEEEKERRERRRGLELAAARMEMEIT
jgi:hypothetical protein